MPNPWIQVWTGAKFYPFNPTPAMIDIEDIAHQLSMICRFNGAVKTHYSVAQHSVHVSELMYERFNPDAHYEATGVMLSQNYAGMMGLLHDAPEAYIGDMVRPLKLSMRRFMKMEAVIEGVIFWRYGLTKNHTALISLLTECDNAMLATERRDVMNGNKLSCQTASEWSLRELPEPWTVSPWSQKDAKEAFMGSFNMYISTGEFK